MAGRTLTTLHGRQDLGDLKSFYSRFREMPLISISNNQRNPLPHANFVATVQHGLPADLHQPSFEPKAAHLAHSWDGFRQRNELTAQSGLPVPPASR